jgi:hypothetical protein
MFLAIQILHNKNIKNCFYFGVSACQLSRFFYHSRYTYESYAYPQDLFLNRHLLGLFLVLV